MPFNNRFAALAEEVFTNVENFYSVSENGSFGRNSSSDYNHKLATWAMELSYAAYNYPNGEELPIIPGAFMGDFVKSANTLLSENGFVNITDLSYGSNESGAHTIGWRPIGGVDTGLLQIYDDIGGNDNVGWDNTSDEELYVWNFLDRLRTLDGNSGRADSGNVAVLAGKDNVVDVIQSSAIRTMPLVVVDVRGTVTGNDWFNDITTQFESDNNRFAALADEVLTNVESYLSSIGLQDPIILITGHSMGAAIANILAARLNETMDSGNIYVYTFATPLDRVSSCFNNIDSYGNVTAVTASDYNHRLATWAMELSYAAYNYPNGEELPIIPGAFMGDFTQTAGMLLEDNGFVNISEYNYTSDSRAAHTIGWRPVEVAVSETSQIINDAGGMYNVYQYNIDDKGSVLYNLLDSVCVYERNTCRSNSGNPEIMDRNVDVLEVSENSLATTTIKNLVVIDIRGSVTLLDWGNDIVTQFAPNNNRFAALADEVLTNVESYLSSTGLQDPIILVTGHSMGAAIANILAARLNETMDSGNIYAYTFTFTRW